MEKPAVIAGFFVCVVGDACDGGAIRPVYSHARTEFSSVCGSAGMIAAVFIPHTVLWARMEGREHSLNPVHPEKHEGVCY